MFVDQKHLLHFNKYLQVQVMYGINFINMCVCVSMCLGLTHAKVPPSGLWTAAGHHTLVPESSSKPLLEGVAKL